MNIVFNSKNDVLTFGKYKNENVTIKKLIKFDISYANWLLGRENITFSEKLKQKIQKKYAEFQSSIESYAVNRTQHFSKHDYSTLGSDEDDRTFVECFYHGDGL